MVFPPTLTLTSYAVPLMPVTTPVSPWNLECGIPLWMEGSMTMLTFSPSSKVWNPLVMGESPLALGFFLRSWRVLDLNPQDLCIYLNPLIGFERCRTGSVD